MLSIDPKHYTLRTHDDGLESGHQGVASISVLSARHFHDEAAAYKFVEARIWPNGALCPHCGGTERNSLMGGKSTRIGTYKCYDCRKPFTVKIGTIFEASHVKLHFWLQAIFLMASSEKRVSSNQLHRTLGVTFKTAWFMSHRIREAMRKGDLGPLSGNGLIVEADETYYGPTKKKRTATTRGRAFAKSGETGPSNKRAILGLVERGGMIRTFHVASATKENVAKLVMRTSRMSACCSPTKAASIRQPASSSSTT